MRPKIEDISGFLNTSAIKALIKALADLYGFNETDSSKFGVEQNKFNGLRGTKAKRLSKDDAVELKIGISKKIMEKSSDNGKKTISEKMIWDAIIAGFKNIGIDTDELEELYARNGNNLFDAMEKVYELLFGELFVGMKDAKVEKIIKPISILVKTDGYALKNIRDLKEENDGRWELNVHEDIQTDVESYDIIYIIIDNLFSEDMEEKMSYLVEEYKSKDVQIRAYLSNSGFCTETDKRRLVRFCSENGIGFKTYNDEQVYLFDLYKDIEKIHSKNQNLMSTRLNGRYPVLEELYNREDRISLITHINDKGWEEVLKDCQRSMNMAKIAYTEYTRERQMIISDESKAERERFADSIIIDALNANVSPEVIGDIVNNLISEKMIDMGIMCARKMSDDNDEHIRSMCKVYSQLGKALLDKKRLSDAVENLRRAYALSEILPNGDEKLKSESLLDYVWALWGSKNLLEAWKLLNYKFDDISELYKKNKEDCYLIMRQAYHFRGLLLRAQGRLSEAEVSYLKALKVIEDKYHSKEGLPSSASVDDKKKYSATCNNLGIVYGRLGYKPFGQKYYDLKRDINKEQNDYIKLGMYYANYAVLLERTANDLKDEELQKSIEKNLNESIQEKRKASDEEKKDPRYNISMYNSYYEFADYYRKIGRFADAQDMLDQAEEEFYIVDEEERKRSFVTEQNSITLEKGLIMLEAALAGSGEIVMHTDLCENYLKDVYNNYKNLRDKNLYQEKDGENVRIISFFDTEILNVTYALARFYAKIKLDKEKAERYKEETCEYIKCLKNKEKKEAKEYKVYSEWLNELKSL